MAEHPHRTIEDTTRGEKVCTRCGEVTEEKIFDHGPEWRSKPEKPENDRADVSTGSDITRHDRGLGSTFRVPKTLETERRQQWRRLWHLHQHPLSWSERTLRDVMIDLDKLCESLSLPKSVKSEIAYWYRKLKKSRLTAGRNHWSVLAALACIVCTQRNIGRTEEEFTWAVGSHSHLSQGTLQKLIKKLCSESSILSKYSRTTVSVPDNPIPRFVEPDTAPQLEQIKFAKSWIKMIASANLRTRKLKRRR